MSEKISILLTSRRGTTPILIITDIIIIIGITIIVIIVAPIKRAVGPSTPCITARIVI